MATYTDNGTNTPNGSHKVFTYTFPALQTEDIKVALNGVAQATTKYTASLSPAQIEFNNTSIDSSVQESTGAPKTGVQVRVFRETTVGKNSGDEDPKAVFAAGSSIRAADLNANQEQALFAIHELQTQPVKTSDIEPDAVTNAKIVDNAIDSEHYVDGSIDRVHLEADIIDGSKIEDNAVNTEHIAATAIRTSQIQNSAVIQDKLANNSVGTPELINGSVNSDKILDGTIVNADISSSAAIDASKIVSATGSVAGTMSASDKAKLDGIESGAKDDQTAAEIKTLLQSNKITDSEIATGTLDNRYFTETELTGGALDGRYFTETESDARYFNVSTGDTIKDGDTFPDNDTTIATTAAINDRIIDLVDDVGGFVPIANETSFPTSNPDVNNGAGTIVSVSAASTNLVPSGTTVTIANGRGSGLAVIITGVSATIPSGFGFLVETTSTDHTYTFHRLSPKATEVTTVAGKATEVTTVHTNITNINAVANNATNINAVAADATDIGAVAGKATEIGRLGTADAVADMAILGTADVVSDLNTLGTADVVADMNMLATSDVVADMNMLAVSDVISDMNDLATSGNITAMSTCSTNIASINNCSTNISSANTFGDQYQVASNNPSTDGGGNALAAGDLYFNTSANELKVYNGSAWQGGVTATGNFAVTTGNTFTGDNRYNDGVKALFGTGSDLEIFHDGSHSFIKDTGTGALQLSGNRITMRNGDAASEYMFTADENGAVELYYDNVKKFQTENYGISTVGDIYLTGDLLATTDTSKLLLGGSNDLQIYHNGTDSYLQNNTGNLFIRGNGDDIFLKAVNTEDSLICRPNGAVELYHDGTKKLETTTNGITMSGHIDLPDQKEVRIGGASLRLRHDGHSIIQNDESGACMFITSHETQFRNTGLTEAQAKFFQDGAVELYYDNSKKFETTSSGVNISSGNLQIGGTNVINSGRALYNLDSLKLADSKIAYFGSGNDLQIYHDGSNSYIKQISSGTGNLLIFADGHEIQLIPKSGEPGIKVINDGAVELYHNGSKKFDTTSNGAIVTGSLGVDELYMGDNEQIKIGAQDDFLIYHGGSENVLDGVNHKIELRHGAEKHLVANPDGAVELYYDNSKKFETTSTGANLTGRLVTDSITIEDDGSNEPLFWLRADDGSPWAFVIGNDNSNTSSSVGLKWYVANNGNAYQQLRGNSAFEEFHLQQSDGSTTNTGIRLNSSRAVELNYQGSEKLSTKSTGVEVTGNLDIDGNIDGADGSKLKLGTGDDLEIYHDGSNSYLSNSTGYLYIQSDNISLAGKSAGENYLVANLNGAVQLYYDSSKRLETRSNGLASQKSGQNDFMIGSTNANGVYLILDGDSNGDFSGSDYAYIAHDTSGNLLIAGDNPSGNSEVIFSSGNDNSRAKFTYDGHFRPTSNNTYDCGQSSYRWRNIYTNDLNLSNEGGANDIDGTWGDWTIQEGESDLFLKNNRSGKKYKFNLTEVL